MARKTIDRLLTQAGWKVCDPDQVNLHAYRGTAIREFPLIQGHEFVDDLRKLTPAPFSIAHLWEVG